MPSPVVLEVRRLLCGACPDLHVTIEDIIASGKPAALTGAAICVVRDGKITEA